MEQPNVRKAISQDSAGLQECMEKAYSIYLSRMDGKPLPPLTVDYADEIEHYPTWVIESEGRIAGGLVMVFKEKYASIANVAVHPDFQKRGFGKALLDFAQGMGNDRGYNEIHLATHVLLTENVSLYRHLGWVEYDRDDMRVYMKKRLE